MKKNGIYLNIIQDLKTVNKKLYRNLDSEPFY